MPTSCTSTSTIPPRTTRAPKSAAACFEDEDGKICGYQGLTASEQRALLKAPAEEDFDDGGPPQLVPSDDEDMTVEDEGGENDESEDEDERGACCEGGRPRPSCPSCPIIAPSCSRGCCNLTRATQASSEAVIQEDSARGRHARREQSEAAADAWRHKRSMCLAEVVYPEGSEELMLAGEDQPRYISLKVVLDSGAGTHVVNRRAIPGYKVMESALSRAGAAFVGADGGRIANHGESLLNIVSEDSKGIKHKITSNFQVADVTKALWSVGLICDSGLDVRFKKHEALVLDPKGNELCRFERIGGLYVTTVMLENPEHQDFQRQGA